jgi:cellobiose epimerase
LQRQKDWWPQAEAMVGFFNAWQISKEEKYLNQSLKSWEFVKSYLLDKKIGEWFSGVNDEHQPIPKADKVGIWKCPYHNGRACIEIIHRINLIS